MSIFKQCIHIEGKCIEDVFNLPCVMAVMKLSDGYRYRLYNGYYAYVGDWLCQNQNNHWCVYTDEEYKMLEL